MNYTSLTRKQRLTVKLFQDAFLTLLDEKPIDTITVVDLCNETDLNRSTFYRYFTDIYDLRDSTIESLFGQIFAVLQELPADMIARVEDPHLAKRRLSQSLRATRKNRALYKKLICENYSGVLEKTLEENLIPFQVTISTASCSEDQKTLYYSYICGGLTRIWIEWINHDCETPIDQMADLLLHVICNFYAMLESIPD